MRKALLICSLLIGGFVGADLATPRNSTTEAQAGAPAAGSAISSIVSNSCVCPLWPIDDYGDGVYLFYAERYEDCEQCLDPEASWYMGSAPGWPYFCPDCWLSASLVSPEVAKRRAAGFQGIDAKVAWHHRPTFPEKMKANDGVYLMSEDFVEFTVPETNESHRAKVYIIKLRPSEGSQRKGDDRIIALGYEVEDHPRSQPTLTVPARKVSSVNGSRHSYRLQVGTLEYLVFLAK